jgi:hypothetical protein
LNDTSVAGTYFMFVVRKTSLADGFALYRGGPDFPLGSVVLPTPEPATTILSATALGVLLMLRRKSVP